MLHCELHCEFVNYTRLINVVRRLKDISRDQKKQKSLYVAVCTFCESKFSVVAIVVWINLYTEPFYIPIIGNC